MAPHPSPLPRPRTIPVVDVLGGQVVRAVFGRRNEYRPVVSRLTTSTSPVEVAAALLRATGAAELYLADLDAITGQRGVSPAVVELLRSPPARVWVDAGFGPRVGVDELPADVRVHPVVGFETAATPGCLAAALAAVGTDRLGFSLDLRNGQLLGNWPGWGLAGPSDFPGLARRVVGMGVRTLFVLDLRWVGSGTGPGTAAVCAALREAFPTVELISGGGVRSWDDVTRLGESGADGVLVASALHDGSLVSTTTTLRSTVPTVRAAGPDGPPPNTL